jgi:pimeloyl-ACP methyl ester carboxylesterase
MSFFIETNGIRLHYLDHASDGPPLLLVPGLTANSHAFDGLVAAGLSERLRVLVPDMRGRGSSDKPDSGYTMADHAADLVGMIHGLGLRRVIVGGHSFGGLLSLVMAARHPELVERIVIIDAAIAMASEQTRAQIKPSLDRLERSYPSFEAYLE